MTKLQLGTNHNISNAEYHSDRNFASSSTLKVALKSIEAYYKQYVVENNFKTLGSNAKDLGSYVHSAILEPHLTPTEFAIFDGAQRRGKAYDEFRATVGSKTIITKAQYDLAVELLLNVGQNKHAPRLLNVGEPEYTYCAEVDGMPVKVRADWLNLAEGYILDVKTTYAELDKKSLQNVISDLSYDLSASLYVDCMSKLGKSLDFYFLFISTKSKEVRVFKASERLLENGRRKYKAAIKKINNAKHTGIWHNGSTDNEIETIDHAEWGTFQE